MGTSSTLVHLDRERGDAPNEENNNGNNEGESESGSTDQSEEFDGEELQSDPADQDGEGDEDQPQSDSMSLDDEQDAYPTPIFPHQATTPPIAPRSIRRGSIYIPSYLTVVRYPPPDSPGGPLRKRHQASLEISVPPMEEPKFLIKGSTFSNTDYTHSHPSIQYRDVDVDAFFHAQWTTYDANTRKAMGGDGDEDGWRMWPRSKDRTLYACAHCTYVAEKSPGETCSWKPLEGNIPQGVVSACLRCARDGAFCIVPSDGGPTVLPFPEALWEGTEERDPTRLGYWINGVE